MKSSVRLRPFRGSKSTGNGPKVAENPPKSAELPQETAPRRAIRKSGRFGESVDFQRFRQDRPLGRRHESGPKASIFANPRIVWGGIGVEMAEPRSRQ